MLILVLAWVLSTIPFDTDLSHKFHINDYGCKITYRVTKKEDTYLYLYSVKNQSKVPMKFKCEVLQNLISLVYDLEPGEHMKYPRL